MNHSYIYWLLSLSVYLLWFCYVIGRSAFRLFVLQFLAQQPPVGQYLLIHEVSRSHIATHNSQYDSSGRVISSSRRSLPDNTQQSKQTNTHAPYRIRTHNLNRRAALDSAATGTNFCWLGDSQLFNQSVCGCEIQSFIS